MESISINSDKAKGITEIFIEQHFSIREIKEPVLENGVWTVEAIISGIGDESRTLRIDAKNGRIIDWHK